MREWTYKTDEKGRPRRFLNHRELVLWVVLKVGQVALPGLMVGLILAIASPQWMRLDMVLWIVSVFLTGYAAVVALLYGYVALSGGVMGSEERHIYLEELRESRRGRW